MPRSASRRIQIELPIHLTITLEDDRAGRERAYNAMLADIVESVERIGTRYYLRPERGERISARIADECDTVDLAPEEAHGAGPGGREREGRDHGATGLGRQARGRDSRRRADTRVDKGPGRQSEKPSAAPPRRRLFLVRDGEIRNQAKAVDPRTPRPSGRTQGKPA